MASYRGRRTAAYGVRRLGRCNFFLISGFVILKTVDTATPRIFSSADFFVSCPLCAAVVIVTAAITFVHCWWQELAQPHSISGVISSTLALNY